MSAPDPRWSVKASTRLAKLKPGVRFVTRSGKVATYQGPNPLVKDHHVVLLENGQTDVWTRTLQVVVLA